MTTGSADFSRLLSPRGLAVVSPRARIEGQPLRPLVEFGFAGEVYPVTATTSEVLGRPCFPSLDSVPGSCDVALIDCEAVDAARHIEACGSAGIGFAVLFNGGFSASQEAELRQSATRAGVAVFGPNCQGFLSVRNRAYAGISGLFDEPRLRPGPTAIVTQSGWGFAIAGLAEAEGMPIGHIVSTGNEWFLDAVDVLEHFAADDDIELICLIVQGVRDGERLIDAAVRAHDAGKTVIGWKLASSRAGKREAVTHTGHLAGEDALYDAAFRAAGIQRARSPQQLADIWKAHRCGRLRPGARVAIVSVSGGAAIEAADALEASGLAVSPPVDVTNAADPATLTSVLSSSASSADALVVCTGGIAGPAAHVLAGAIAQAAHDIRVPLLAAFSARPGSAPDAEATLTDARIPQFPTPARAAFALAVAARPGPRPRASAPELTGVSGPSGALGTHASLEKLSTLGLPVAPGVLLSLEEANAAATLPFNFPVSVKLDAHDVPHKAARGLVHLNVSGIDQLRSAAAALAGSGVASNGILVQPMVAGLELMMGFLNDETFGPLVTFGLGGSFAEAEADIGYALAPVDESGARALVLATRAGQALVGSTVDRLIAAIVRLSRAPSSHIAEIDVNPIIATPDGIFAVDALVVLR